MAERNTEEGLKVFYSYSHKDEGLRDELDKHLYLLQRQKLITTWHDRRITAGAEWKGAIDENLVTADIILLLISSDFISSDYCFDVEMNLALEKHQANEASVIPIILRAVDWSGAPFAKLQALPKDGRPVTKWVDRDEAFTNIAEGIRKVILSRLAERANKPDMLEIEHSMDLLLLTKSQTQTHTSSLQIPEQLDVTTIERTVNYLAERFDGQLLELDNSGELLQFKLDLHHVCLRGTDEPISGIAVWTDTANLELVARELAGKVFLSFGIVFCFSDSVNKALDSIQSMKGFCVLSPANINSLLNSQDPLNLLLKLIVAQIGIRRLSPYNITQPAKGSMFFGRKAELEKLILDRDANYAIFGPSQIGKSSLIFHYKWLSLNQISWLKPSRMFSINMGRANPNSILRFIAMNIHDSRRSDRVTERDFSSFLRYMGNRLGGPLELLLDEVDEVCTSPAFEQLGDAAKEGLVRLILCGRGGLMRFAMNPASRFSMRLQILRPGALEWEAAQNALIKPMDALGISYENKECVDYVCLMTGSLPFLLQYYGRSLVDRATKTNSSTITMKMIEEFENRFDHIHFMMRPILEIQEPSEGKVVLTLLRGEKSIYTVADISAIAADEGEKIEPNQIFDLCNALCIHGVLVYEDGVFRIANQALRDLAFKSGYLDLID